MYRSVPCSTVFSGSGWSNADFLTNKGSLDLGLLVVGSLVLDSVLVELGELLEPPELGLPGLLVLGSYRLMLLNTLAPPGDPDPTPRPAPPKESNRGS